MTTSPAQSVGSSGSTPSNAAGPVVHALSFDIEDWFHIVEIPAVEDPSLWPGLSAQSSLVERYTDLILRICDDHKTRATFYILGWIADKHPALVKRIADAGHEVGTHSFWHRKVYELTPEVFSKDIADSIAAINAGRSQRPMTYPWIAHCVNQVKGKKDIISDELGIGSMFLDIEEPGCRGPPRFATGAVGTARRPGCTRH